MTRRQSQLRALVAAVTASDGDVRWIDTASDPQAVEDLTEVIANLLRDFEPDGVACWVGDNDAVLVHSIARRLGVSVARTKEDMGLLTMEPKFAEESRSVVMFASSWNGRNSAAAIYAMLTNYGKEIGAVVALLPGDPKPESIPDDVPYLVLAE